MSVIVVGFVPKPEGRAAIAAARVEAERRGSKVLVVNSHRGGQEFESGAGQRTQDEMDQVGRDFEAAGVEYEVHQLVRGNDPADDLISIATEQGAELIVIGLRRRTPVGKLILGSNAQQILLGAPCPVLAVKA